MDGGDGNSQVVLDTTLDFFEETKVGLVLEKEACDVGADSCDGDAAQTDNSEDVVDESLDFQEQDRTPTATARPDLAAEDGRDTASISGKDDCSYSGSDSASVASRDSKHRSVTSSGKSSPATMSTVSSRSPSISDSIYSEKDHVQSTRSRESLREKDVTSEKQTTPCQEETSCDNEGIVKDTRDLYQDDFEDQDPSEVGSPETAITDSDDMVDSENDPEAQRAVSLPLQNVTSKPESSLSAKTFSGAVLYSTLATDSCSTDISTTTAGESPKTYSYQEHSRKTDTTTVVRKQDSPLKRAIAKSCELRNFSRSPTNATASLPRINKKTSSANQGAKNMTPGSQDDLHEAVSEQSKLPHIPKILKSEAVYQNGQLEVKIAGMDSALPSYLVNKMLHVGGPQLPFGLKVAFVSSRSTPSRRRFSKPRVIPISPPRSPPNLDVITTRAQGPPFNTKLDPQSKTKLNDRHSAFCTYGQELSRRKSK